MITLTPGAEIIDRKPVLFIRLYLLPQPLTPLELAGIMSNYCCRRKIRRKVKELGIFAVISKVRKVVPFVSSRTFWLENCAVSILFL